MAGVFDRLFEQNFTTTNTISITHNLDLQYLKIKIIVGNENREDLIDNVLVDSSDPTNKLTVNLKSAQTGRVQLFGTDFISVGEFAASRKPVRVQKDDIEVVSNVRTLNFEGSASVVDDGSGKATVTITSGGVFGMEFQKAESLGISTTNSETFQNKVTLNTTSLPAGTYRIGVSYGWNHDDTGGDFEARVREDGVNIGEIHKQEPKDSSGSFSTSGSSQRHYANRTFYRTLTAGTYTYTLDFRTDDDDDESSIWDAIIELWRVS